MTMENGMLNGWEGIGEKKEKKEEVKYLKFPEGTSVIRLMDASPRTRISHWIPQAQGGKGYGIDCIGKGCPVCDVIRQERKEGKKELTYKNKVTHSINALVRKLGGVEKNEIMVLEQGNGMFGQIKDQLGMLAQMGMPKGATEVDLFITRNGLGFSDTKYTVMANAMASAPLTETELAMEKYKLDELKPTLDAAKIIMLMSGMTLDEVIKEEEDASAEIS